jgi:hypothetical protein
MFDFFLIFKILIPDSGTRLWRKIQKVIFKIRLIKNVIKTASIYFKKF